jgi:DNA ligase-1
VHRAGFQKIVSMAKNASDMAAASKELQYWIYDLYDPARPNLPTNARMELLAALFSSASASASASVGHEKSKLRLVSTSVCAKEAEIAGILERHEKAGYEGVMLRNPDAPYAPGKRSNGLLKLKSFVDGEFEIVGFEEATGKDKGTVVFVCSISSSKFRVRPIGTLAERAKMLKDAPKLVGKKLTVRYQELSDDGIPRFPVGIAVRDYE